MNNISDTRTFKDFGGEIIHRRFGPEEEKAMLFPPDAMHSREYW